MAVWKETHPGAEIRIDYGVYLDWSSDMCLSSWNHHPGTVKKVLQQNKLGHMEIYRNSKDGTWEKWCDKKKTSLLPVPEEEV